MRLLLAALVAALALGACIPPEPDDDQIVNWDPEETIMGEIQQREKLRIGVPRGRPPFDELASGLGTLVAEALGVEAEIVPLRPDTMVDAPEEGRVDISFATVTITEKLVRKRAFTDPYYIAHQRLLIDERADIRGIEHVEGRVCQFITREVHNVGDLNGDKRDDFELSPIGVNVKELNPKVTVYEPPATDECIEDLVDGKVEAITASDWLLFPTLVKTPGLAVVGDDLTTEAYGAVVISGASAWLDFVNSVLAEAQDEGDWARLYNSSFGPLVTGEVLPPDMTVEEAAALYPKDL